jgi:farnesyl diphosphate synthase
LRPFLLLNSAALFNVPVGWAMPSAAAIEMVHTYSLIHDDLPTMDDDDFRRGKPTCHKQFDEATAILAGDALLTLAFETVADPSGHPEAEVRTELVHALAVAAGGLGMVGGQVMDLAAEIPETTLDLEAVTRLQAGKTGALFRFSCTAGAVLAQRSGAERKALTTYADRIGLAFQIADDLLDVEGSELDMGKAVGKDADAGKATFVDLLGVEGARVRAMQLTQEAVAALELFGSKAELLRDVARFIVDRRN